MGHGGWGMGHGEWVSEGAREAGEEELLIIDKCPMFNAPQEY